MAGNKNSGRPGGYPDIKKVGFKTDRAEPCSDRIQLRLSSSDKESLQAIPEWREKLRDYIKILIAENSEDIG